MAAEYYPKIEQIAVLFWDLNNLKSINDLYGHAVGDMAIEKLSAALYVHSDDRCRVYRIGGDEFLMIIDYPVTGETERIIDSVQGTLKEAKEDIPIQVSSAVGCGMGRGKDILEIVETADVSMYENKKRSKENRA